MSMKSSGTQFLLDTIEINLRSSYPLYKIILGYQNYRFKKFRSLAFGKKKMCRG